MHCDVAVIGAGAAGIAAAVAAANAGAKVAIVERHGFTGGLATTAMVGTICGLFYRHPSEPRYAVQGFARKFAEAVQAKCQSSITRFAEGLHFLPYRPEAFHREALYQLQQAGVTVLLYRLVVGVEVNARRVSEIRLQSSDRQHSLYPSTVVDCSGNAQVSLFAGLDRISENTYQAGAFVFQVRGLPLISPELMPLELIRWLKRGIQAGDLDPQCDRLSIIPGSLTQGMALLKLGMSIPFDGSAACRKHYELDARLRSVAIVNYLKSHEPLLANLSISAMATEVGIRTSERSQGLELLDENHVLTCAKPDDGVAIGAWPMEIWGAERKPKMRYFSQGDAYWISADMLVSCHLDNLFFAGRCLSATEEAMASARVIGTCLGTGYAAGWLAAELADTGSWQTAIPKIRHHQIDI